MTSEEIATAAADLATVQQLRAELHAARSLIDGMRRTQAELRRQLHTADAEIAAYAERAEQAERNHTELVRWRARGPMIHAMRAVVSAARSFPNKLIMDHLEEYDRELAKLVEDDDDL